MQIRRFNRLHTTLPMRYEVGLLESEESWSGEGIIRNISLGGVYFTCNAHLPLEPGHIHNFTIATAFPCPSLNDASNIRALGLVVRVERPASDRAAFGVAVKFLTPLNLSQV